MKKGHSGKVSYYLEIYTGQIITTKELGRQPATASFIKVGLFYSFVTMLVELDTDKMIWHVYRGGQVEKTLIFSYGLSEDESNEYRRRMADKMTKLLTNQNTVRNA